MKAHDLWTYDLLKVIIVESVGRTRDNIQHICLFNMATRESMRSQHALQAKSLHNKYIYGHNHTPPFLIQSSELIGIDEIECLGTVFHP